MKLKRAVSLLIGAVMMLGMFSGCQKKNEIQDNSSGANSGDSGKTYKISIVTPVNGPVDKNNDVQKFLNTLVPGLEVEITALEIGSYWDLLNPRMASNEIPDVFHCHNETMYTKYITQNLLTGISPDVIKKNMPKFVEGTKEYDTAVWSLVLKDGMIYGLPAMDEAQTRPFTNAWRGDWLKKLGINKVPETVEEYEDALTKITFNDPDGNGVNDTYGTTMRGKDATPNLFSSLFGAYGIFPNMWNMSEDGTLKYGIIDPRGKEALVTLNKWFKKGIIDPEFTAVDGGVRTEKWANSKIGMMCDSTYYEINPGNSGYENLKALSPNAEIVRGPAPKGPKGDYGYMNWSKFTNKLVFGKPLGNDPVKAEKFLQLWEIVNTDPDAYNRVKYGEENTNWKRQENGSIVNIAPYNNVANRGALGINAFDQGCLVPIPKVKAQALSKNLEEEYQYAVKGTLVNGKDYFSYLGKFVTTELDKINSVEANDIYSKNIIDFITGARPISQYDDFVKEWHKAGGEEITKVYNGVYKKVDGIINQAQEIFK